MPAGDGREMKAAGGGRERGGRTAGRQEVGEGVVWDGAVGFWGDFLFSFYY